jgi:hypothetical protein
MLVWLVAMTVESACEKPGPVAKPVTSAVALPGGDTDAASVARALPLKCDWLPAFMKPGKKEILVPDGNGPGVETEAWIKSS